MTLKSTVKAFITTELSRWSDKFTKYYFIALWVLQDTFLSLNTLNIQWDEGENEAAIAKQRWGSRRLEI